MVTRTILLDNEAELTLKKLKENIPEFNFSNFVRLALIEKSQSRTDLDEPTLLKNLNDCKIKVQQANEDVYYWEQRLKDYEVQKEVRRLQEEQEKREKEERIKKQQQVKINIMKIFKDEIGREMTEFEYEEYTKLEKGNIWSFCDRIKSMSVEEVASNTA